MNDVIKHNLLAIGGSFLVSCTLLGLLYTPSSTGDFIACALFMSVFLFVAYVYARSYLIDAKASERFRAQEKLCLFVCFLACYLISQGINLNRGLPSQFSAYVFLVGAGLIAWGSYRIARRAIIQQFVADQKLQNASETEPQKVGVRPAGLADTENREI